MENEKMQVNFAPGMTEATLRVIELHEENELPVLEPDKVELAGTIGSVYEFLLKRISEKEQINQKRCYILVDREKMTLKLVTNETTVGNLIKEESRKHKTDSLMADGGSLVFEKRLEQIVDKEFEKRGLQLLTFSAQLEFSDKVREKIDSRNEVNTNISVLDQQIEEQKKRNELEQLKTEQALIQSRGLTKEILYKQFIDKWDGTSPLYGIAPEFLKITK